MKIWFWCLFFQHLEWAGLWRRPVLLLLLYSSCAESQSFSSYSTSLLQHLLDNISSSGTSMPSPIPSMALPPCIASLLSLPTPPGFPRGDRSGTKITILCLFTFFLTRETCTNSHECHTAACQNQKHHVLLCKQEGRFQPIYMHAINSLKRVTKRKPGRYMRKKRPFAKATEVSCSFLTKHLSEGTYNHNWELD